ncbi:MAG: CHAT domain-containing tetratricopeptide repeat protein [FCB group bacterium]|jgi:CHAT domain-containing protein
MIETYSQLQKTLIFFVTTTIFFALLVFTSTNAFSQSWEELIERTGKYIQAKNIDSALSCADRALKVAVNESTTEHVYTLGMIGQIYYDNGNYNKASEYFLIEKNLKQTLYGKNNPSYATSLNNLSSAYQFLGRYQEAEQLLLEAIDIKISNNNKDTIIAKSYHNLGKLYHSMGYYEKSEKYYLKALEIKKSVCGQNHILYANTLYNLGQLYKSFGNFQSAEKKLEQAYDIYLSNGYVSILPTIELHLAGVYYNLKMTTRFVEILNKQKKYIQNIDENSPDCGITYYEIALLYVMNENYKDAELLLEKAEPIIEKQYGKTSPIFISCLNALGIVNWIQGDLNKANKYLTQVVSLREVFFGDKNFEYATAVHNLAGLQIEMKDFEQADNNYSNALTIYLSLIRIYFPYLSEIEKARFNQNINERFDMFYNYVLQRNTSNPNLISEMFNYRLATKAILLNNSMVLKNKIKNSGDAGLINDYENLIKTKENLSVAYRYTKKEAEILKLNTDSLESVANQLEKNISRKFNEFKEKNEKIDLTWKDIQNKLNADEAAVEIVAFKYFSKGWNDKTFYVALIVKKETKEHPDFVLINNDSSFESGFYKNYIHSIKYKIMDKDSYYAFWEKIDQKIEGKNRVYISLDGVYNKINLNTITTPSNKYLFEEKEIITLTSIGDLLNFKNTNSILSSEKEAYLFGAPDFNFNFSSKTSDIENSESKTLPIEINTIKITPIPDSKNEVINISEILTEKSLKTKVFLGDKATVSQLKTLKNALILHIATHGFFLSDINPTTNKQAFGLNIFNAIENPYLRTGLLFAGAENTINKSLLQTSQADNGILTAYDVLNLDFGNPELVVLSACETGLGEVQNGEGVYGLQRAFQINGAKTIIMSLWKVDDNVTNELMTALYKNWMNGQNINSAFREAQLQIKEKYKDPYYWGAFIMVGK